VGMFFVGSCLSIYHGIQSMLDPQPLQGIPFYSNIFLEENNQNSKPIFFFSLSYMDKFYSSFSQFIDLWVALAVIGISTVIETVSFTRGVAACKQGM
jgi:hypothetical protein